MSDKKKILMIGQFPPHIGGVGVHIYSLAKAIVKRGDEVDVLTYPHKYIKDMYITDNNNNNNNSYENKESNEYKNKGKSKIKVHGTFGINIGGLRSLFFTLSGTIKAINLIRKNNIDIIHGHYLFPSGLVTVLAGKITKKPVFVTAHGSDMFCLYKQHSFMRPVVKFVLKNADEVLVVSEALKKEVLATDIPNIDKKVKINWNVVDIEKFKPIAENDDSLITQTPNLQEEFGIDKNKYIIMFVGNLIARKKVQYLIKAKKLLKSNCAIVIVGDGPKAEELKNLVDSEGIEDIIFTGPRDDVEKLIPQSTILVLPSVSESFGLVLIEALACGKPVIGSNVEGITEIITDDVGILVEPRNENLIADAIDKILMNDDLRHNMEKNAVKRAIDFSKIEIPY